MKVNYISGLVTMGVTLAFPLLTAPYISRVLGPESLGKIGFALSFLNWFIILANLNITAYAAREIGKVQDDYNKRSEVFSELLYISIWGSFIATLLYLAIVFCIADFQKDKLLYCILALQLVASPLSVDWLFNALGKNQYIAMRTVCIKIIAFILIFVFVKTVEDYYQYIIILSMSVVVANIVNFVTLPKYVRINRKNVDLKKHLLPLTYFAVGGIVYSLYNNIDIFCLQIFTTSQDVGLYYRNKQIIMSFSIMCGTLSRVLSPRMANYFFNDKVSYYQTLNQSFQIFFFLIFPIIVGCALLSENLVWILGGPAFLEAHWALKIAALTLLFNGLIVIFDLQISFPAGYERFSVIASSLLLVSSLACIYLSIENLSYFNVTLAIVLANIIVVCFLYFMLRKRLKFVLVQKNTIKYLIASCIMGGIIYGIKFAIGDYIISLIISGLLGALVYLLVLFYLKENIVLPYILLHFQKNRRKGEF